VDEDSQDDLVTRARAGHHDAWEALYRHAYPRLRAYAAARVGSGGAEDLVNETMARAVAGIGRFRREPGGFDAWLFGILRRVCLEYFRREGRRRNVGVQSFVDTADPGEEMDLADEHRMVRKAFAQLTPAEQEVLELRLISGLSAEEAARVLGKRAGAVRTAQSRALANLRGLVGDDL